MRTWLSKWKSTKKTRLFVECKPRQIEQLTAEIMYLTHLANRTSGEVGNFALLVVPLGSTEQHGPHLPLNTDTVIASRLADELVRRIGAGLAVVAPAISISASGEHKGFPGTLSIGTETLSAVIVELARSATPPEGSFPTVLFVNAHGGNLGALTTAGKVLIGERRRAYHWSPRLPSASTDSHAGRIETSLMLHLSPHTVRTELLEVGNITPITELEPELRAGGVVAVSKNGILGDPRRASAEFGEELFTIFSHDLEAVARAVAL